MKIKSIGEKLKKINKKKAALSVATAGASDVVIEAGKKIKKLKTDKMTKNRAPISLKEFNSPNFHIPNVIVIVDDATYIKYDKFKEAVGLLSETKKTQIFEIYDEFARDSEKSKLVFTPSIEVMSVYYMDPHNPNHFIRVEEIASKIQDQVFAELERIATCLGVKSYSIEFIEEKKEEKSMKQNSKIKGSIKAAKAEISESHENESAFQNKSNRNVYMEFKKTKKPKKPELCWFKNDPGITSLVKTIVDEKRKVEKRDFTFKCSAYMSQVTNTTASIGAEIKKLGANISSDVKTKQKKEASTSIIYKLRF